MNTVDALNVLGKALCGDSFEVKPGLTDAETILEIAKNYEGGGSGSGSGGSNEFLIPVTMTEQGTTMSFETTMPFMMIRTAYEAGKDLALDAVDGTGRHVKFKLTYAIGARVTPEAANIDLIRGIIFIGFSGTMGTIRSIDISSEHGDASATAMQVSTRTFSVANS